MGIRGDEDSAFERGGDVIGDGSGGIWSDPRGSRGFGIRSGEAGALGILPGEGWRCGEGIWGSLRLRRLRSPVLADRAAISGDSVLRYPKSAERVMLVSLSAASLSHNMDARLLNDSDRLSGLPKALERGVGHSMGLLDLVDDTAADDCRRSNCETTEGDSESRRRGGGSNGTPSSPSLGCSSLDASAIDSPSFSVSEESSLRLPALMLEAFLIAASVHSRIKALNSTRIRSV